MSLTITVPPPGLVLSPNGRCHWRVKAKAVKALRERAMFSALAALRVKLRAGLSATGQHKAATVLIRWFTKTIRRPDADNALASLKAAFDGVADSGYLSNDRGLTYLPIEFAKDAKNPRVEITFTPSI